MPEGNGHVVMEADGAAQDAAFVRAPLSALIEPGSLLEATPECLVVTAADGMIVFANHRVEQLTGSCVRSWWANRLNC